MNIFEFIGIVFVVCCIIGGMIGARIAIASLYISLFISGYSCLVLLRRVVFLGWGVGHERYHIDGIMDFVNAVKDVIQPQGYDLALGILGGVLAIVFHKFSIVVITSLIGAILLSIGFGNWSYVLIITAIGVLWQYKVLGFNSQEFARAFAEHSTKEPPDIPEIPKKRPVSIRLSQAIAIIILFSLAAPLQFFLRGHFGYVGFRYVLWVLMAATGIAGVLLHKKWGFWILYASFPFSFGRPLACYFPQQLLGLLPHAWFFAAAVATNVMVLGLLGLGHVLDSKRKEEKSDGQQPAAPYSEPAARSPQG